MVKVKQSFLGKVPHGTITVKTIFGRDIAQESESTDIKYKLFWKVLQP